MAKTKRLADRLDGESAKDEARSRALDAEWEARDEAQDPRAVLLIEPRSPSSLYDELRRRWMEYERAWQERRDLG